MAAEIRHPRPLSNGRLISALAPAYQPYEFEASSASTIARNLEMTMRLLRNPRPGLQSGSLQLSRQALPDGPRTTSHPGAAPVQNPMPIYVAGTRRRCPRGRGKAIRVGVAALGGIKLWEQYADNSRRLRRTKRCESGRISRSNACPFNPGSREEGMRVRGERALSVAARVDFRRRQEVCRKPTLSMCPFPDEPPNHTIYEDLLLGDVETVAEELVAEIHATKPGTVCFSSRSRHAHASGYARME